MKLLVFCDNYPRPGPGYADTFVRVRLESYLLAIHAEIIVVKLSRKASTVADYELDGVSVQHHTHDSLPGLLASFAPNVILAHFIQAHLCKLLPTYASAPLLIWVHGEEALSWTRRLFYLRTLGPISFFKYVASNHWQRAAMAQLFRAANESDQRIQFIFVSEWMRRIAEADVGVHLRSYSIIPNHIDGAFFNYVEKPTGTSRNILLIRSFNSAKYANDLAIAAIEKLNKEYSRFPELHFTIVGEGKLWDTLTSRINFPNVTLVNRSLAHDEIRRMHAEHGVFLCPTRQDAQGVSMCEAMSSGLVPITSDNTAIPEFVSTQEGYLSRSVDDIAAAIVELAENSELFSRMSAAAARAIRARTGYSATISREIEQITSAAARKVDVAVHC